MDDRLEIINWIQGKEELPDIVVGQDRVWVGQVIVAEPELLQPGAGGQQPGDTRPVQTVAIQNQLKKSSYNFEMNTELNSLPC